MGDSADNINIISHQMRGTGTSDFGLRRHLGSASIDTDSPHCSKAEWRAFRNAGLSGTDAQMDATGISAFGSWYSDHVVTPGNRATLRDLIQDQCG